MTTVWDEEVAVITGAAGAMGGAVAKELLRRGTKVAGIDLGSALDGYASTLGDLGANFLGVPTDIKSRDDIVAAFETVNDRFGLSTMLATFAAVTSSADSILDCTADQWERVLCVDLAGTFWVCQQAMSQMIPNGKGSIVTIASLAGIQARQAYQSHIYAAAKGGVIALSTSLAAEAGPHGIRVNCIAPGLHKSPMWSQGANAETLRVYQERWIADSPLQRVADPEDMVGPTLFLLGAESAYITGQLLISDGGKSRTSRRSPA
jgi:NAD(P)-dependent dehydrogenase (short-subunit alcohol dehydrogenase family)